MPLKLVSVNEQFLNIADKIDTHRSIFIDWLNFKVINTIPARDFILSIFKNLTLEEIEKDGELFYKYTHIEHSVIIEYQYNEIGNIIVKISSKGLSEYFSNNGYDLDSFLKWILANCQYKETKNGSFVPVGITRIDFAIDDFSDLINIQKLIDLEVNGQTITRLRKVSFIHGFDHPNRCYTGKTFYYGDRAASLFIRFYDKYAKCKQQKVEIDDSIKCWNRMELELKDLKANVFLYNYLYNENFSPFETILSFIRFTEEKIPLEERNRQRYATAEFYEEFLENTKTITRLKVPQLIYDLENLERYVQKTVASALDVYVRVKGLDSVLDVIDNIKSATNGKPKYRKILEENDFYDYSKDEKYEMRKNKKFTVVK
jgi:hypothetical protein